MPVKELIETGKSVEAAIESACEKLGCNREDCQWEIVDLPKRGFLGLKNTPAKARVWIEVPEEKPVAKAPVQTTTQREEPKAQGAREFKPSQAPRSGGRTGKFTPAPERKNNEADTRREQPDTVFEADPAKIKLAKDYVADIISKMNLEADLSVAEEDSGICININGIGLGAVIGRRGETLDAMQYLTSLVANRSDGGYMRVTIDCGDYRAKRKETLEALARKLASQVLKTGMNRSLEPMNPFERRIIHATVSEINGATSISTGEEPNRRVVITTAGSRPRGGRPPQRRPGTPQSAPEHRSANPHPHGGRRDNRGPNPRRSNAVRENAPNVSKEVKDAPPKKTPESAVNTDKPLYTKIDLE